MGSSLFASAPSERTINDAQKRFLLSEIQVLPKVARIDHIDAQKEPPPSRIQVLLNVARTYHTLRLWELLERPGAEAAQREQEERELAIISPTPRLRALLESPGSEAVQRDPEERELAIIDLTLLLWKLREMPGVEAAQREQRECERAQYDAMFWKEQFDPIKREQLDPEDFVLVYRSSVKSLLIAITWGWKKSQLETRREELRRHLTGREQAQYDAMFKQEQLNPENIVILCRMLERSLVAIITGQWKKSQLETWLKEWREYLAGCMQEERAEERQRQREKR
jgi:hypothetical protein